MTTGGADSFRSDQHSWTDDRHFVDRIAQCHVDKFAAGNKTTAQVAHGCESRFNSRACKHRRANRLLGNVQIKFLQSTLIVITGVIGGQMCVRIHEAGGKCCVSEIDHLRAAWERQVTSRIDNFVAAHDHHAVLQE